MLCVTGQLGIQISTAKLLGEVELPGQVCLAAVMAQVGAWVPAESMELTPVDALFVRSGARDAIMSGQVLTTPTNVVAAHCITHCARPG